MCEDLDGEERCPGIGTEAQEGSSTLKGQRCKQRWVASGVVCSTPRTARGCNGLRSLHASVEKISHSNGSKPDEPWENLAFPTYLQSEVDDFCQDWDEALQVRFASSFQRPVQWKLCCS